MEDGITQLVEDSRSLWLPNIIPEYVEKGNAIQFLRDHVGQSVPCVWRGAAKNWPAVAKWGSDNCQHLRDKVGNKTIEVAWTPDGRADSIVRVVSNDGVEQMAFAIPEQRKQTFGDLLDELSWGNSKPTTCVQSTGKETTECGVPYYSAQDSSLTREVPELMDEVDESVIDFAVEAFGEQASAVNLWCGDGRSVTTMHADPFENMYAVATGTKIFRLRPPCDAAILKKPKLQNARWHRMSQANMDEAGEKLDTRQKYKGWELVKEEGETNWIDESQIDERCGRELEVRVEAGDILYLPALWCT